MKRITNSEMQFFTVKREEYNNSKESCYARWANIQIRHYDEHGEDTHEDSYEELYIVFSYGSHWPLLIYSKAAQQWFANSSRTSATTSKHLAQAWPAGVTREEITWLDCEDMKLCASKGVAWLVRWQFADDNRLAA